MIDLPILDWQLNGRYKRDAVIAALGYIPAFVSETDPRPAWEQFNERYIGGWNAMLPSKWKLDQNDYLHYPGDPPLEPLAFAYCHGEKIIIYRHAFVCIVQTNGDFSVARMD